MNVAATLKTAMERIQAGHHAEAEPLLRSLLEVDPLQVDAWHLLGLVLHATGRSDEGAEHIRTALRLKPEFADAHYNLGKMLHDQGKAQEARVAYEHCIQLRPNCAEAHFNLGNALNDLKNPEQAAQAFREAVRLRPKYLKALNNLGRTLIELDRHAEAVAVLQQAVQFDPRYAGAYCNLGSALRGLGRLDEAVAACQKSNELAPGSCLASLGAALLDLELFDEAEAAFRQAIEHKPQQEEGYRNLAVVCLNRGNLAGAVEWNARALDVMPDSPETRLQQAMLWLQLGDYERGWPEYEWRWRCKEFSARAPRKLPWDGSPIAGQTMLLHAEQGLGDTLQFIRFAPLVKERARTVMLRCSPRLIPLLSRCSGIDQFVPTGATLPVYEAEAPLMSLPRALQTTLDTIPNNVPYLHAEPERVERWRERLPAGAFNVGIAWQGNPDYKSDKSRSFPLSQLAPLAAVAGVRLISLQKQHGVEQIAEVRERFEVMELGADFDAGEGAFVDAAAVIKSLDLVVSCDSAIGHLAGGLGAPVWLATAFMPEWRWLLEREDTPWYPTMRLFRQTKLSRWEDVFERMAVELQQAVERGHA